MAIHPSSLNLSPIRLNQNTGRNATAQNKDRPVEKYAPSQSQPSSTDEIKKTLANVDLQNQSNIIKPIDSKTLRALSAYRQEFNAPHQAKLAQSITGIDAYA